MALIEASDNVPALSADLIARPSAAHGNGRTRLKLRLADQREAWYVVEADLARSLVLAFNPALDEMGFLDLAALEGRGETTKDATFTERDLDDVRDPGERVR